MYALHMNIGLHALACGDTDSAQVEFNMILSPFIDNTAFNIAQLARVRLAQVELCHHSPASCLAFICSAETPGLSADSIFSIQLLCTEQCLFIQELDQAVVHIILCLVLAKSISDDSCFATSLQCLGDLFFMAEKKNSSANTCY